MVLLYYVKKISANKVYRCHVNHVRMIKAMIVKPIISAEPSLDKKEPLSDMDRSSENSGVLSKGCTTVCMGDSLGLTRVRLGETGSGVGLTGGVTCKRID